ncbi:MAG: hypothetical protein HYX96_08470 [Chloroflexi bacterium]|nr:hypothetical protein [Chloroflexota bacterium]
MDEKKAGAKQRRVPLGQKLFDDVYLLLALGLGVPLIIYVVWSVVDVLTVPPFTP